MKRCAVCKTPLPKALTGRPRMTCNDACRARKSRQARKRSVHFSSKTCEWSTPPEVFAALDAEFGFDLDPCATAENATCSRYFTRAEDGLAQEWTGRVFVNPPYGRHGGYTIGDWMRKAYESAQAGATVVCLVPARPGSAWWHDYAARGEVRFLRGRLRFGGGDNAAPFDSAVVVFRDAETVTKPALKAA